MENASKAPTLNNGSILNYAFDCGYRTCIWRNLHDKTVIIVLTNQSDTFSLQEFMTANKKEL